jgi:hypothetical protein
MPEGRPLGFDWAGIQFPAWALPAWSPFWAGTIKWNAQDSEHLGTIASEWQSFVSGRLREDFALMQRIAHSCTPDQVRAAYADFWQKAVEDYAKEYMVMGQLVACVTRKLVVESIAEEASADFRASRIG